MIGYSSLDPSWAVTTLSTPFLLYRVSEFLTVLFCPKQPQHSLLHVCSGQLGLGQSVVLLASHSRPARQGPAEPVAASPDWQGDVATAQHLCRVNGPGATEPGHLVSPRNSGGGGVGSAGCRPVVNDGGVARLYEKPSQRARLDSKPSEN